MATNHEDAAAVLEEHRAEILEGWIEGQRNDPRIRADRISDDDLVRDSRKLLDAFIEAISSGGLEDVDAPAYDGVRQLLSEISLRRERGGLTAFGTAASILSFKEYCLPFMRNAGGDSAESIQALSRLIDTLGLVTYQIVVRRREDTIGQQAEELLEISTPVVQVWEGVVAAPLIGTLDSERTQRFMERLLETIVETNSPVALVDITGVPAIDTQTAQHLIDTVSAVRLLGSQVILTGVRPAIAQTLVHLGINLSDVTTRSSFEAGLRVALEKVNLQVAPVSAEA